MAGPLFSAATLDSVAAVNDPFPVLDSAVEVEPDAIVALLSGGHDSLTATAVAHEWAAERGREIEVAHINTGIGVPQTNQFVRDVCAERGWKLSEYHPPRDYDSLVQEFGFPGPANHGMMYQRLKERCLRQVVRERKVTHRGKVLLVTGVRSAESVRRMRHVEQQQIEGAKVWAAPIWDWSKRECHAYLEEKGLPRNEVVDMIHMSGECLCGAFARPGEIKELEMWFPEVAGRIHELEAKVREKRNTACVWGVRPERVHRDQIKLDVGPLCGDCELGLRGAAD